MKKFIFSIFMLAISGSSFATMIIVDINGAGQFTSIQTAINNAVGGDTIQVWPGTYNEFIDINKNIVIQGSGYENTILTSSHNPTVVQSAGKIKWFLISCLAGSGVNLTHGTMVNCVIKSCNGCGIWTPSTGDGIVQNCILIYNGSWGIDAACSATTVVNCISRSNSNTGYHGGGWNWCSGMNIMYSNGSITYTYNNQGVIDSDPLFVSVTDYHLSTGSPCFNTGQPSLSDPDGSVSDMGYFGGPDCPIFPVVYEMTVSPNGTNINVQAKARANY